MWNERHGHTQVLGDGIRRMNGLSERVSFLFDSNKVVRAYLVFLCGILAGIFPA
jgi:hypothetical protein